LIDDHHQGIGDEGQQQPGENVGVGPARPAGRRNRTSPETATQPSMLDIVCAAALTAGASETRSDP